VIGKLSGNRTNPAISGNRVKSFWFQVSKTSAAAFTAL